MYTNILITVLQNFLVGNLKVNVCVIGMKYMHTYRNKYCCVYMYDLCCLMYAVVMEYFDIEIGND